MVSPFSHQKHNDNKNSEKRNRKVALGSPKAFKSFSFEHMLHDFSMKLDILERVGSQAGFSRFVVVWRADP